MLTSNIVDRPSVTTVSLAQTLAPLTTRPSSVPSSKLAVYQVAQTPSITAAPLPSDTPPRVSQPSTNSAPATTGRSFTNAELAGILVAVLTLVVSIIAIPVTWMAAKSNKQPPQKVTQIIKGPVSFNMSFRYSSLAKRNAQKRSSRFKRGRINRWQCSETPLCWDSTGGKPPGRKKINWNFPLDVWGWDIGEINLDSLPRPENDQGHQGGKCSISQPRPLAASSTPLHFQRPPKSQPAREAPLATSQLYESPSRPPPIEQQLPLLPGD